jgi:hypothetical protein
MVGNGQGFGVCLRIGSVLFIQCINFSAECIGFGGVRSLCGFQIGLCRGQLSTDFIGCLIGFGQRGGGFFFSGSQYGFGIGFFGRQRFVSLNLDSGNGGFGIGFFGGDGIVGLGLHGSKCSLGSGFFSGEFCGKPGIGFAHGFIQCFGQQLSGAADIPLTRLFGQSPAGLNATGEADTKTYYDGILRRQEAQLREPLTKLLQIIYRDRFGEPMPAEVSFNFVPLWQLTEIDRANVASTDAASVTAAYTAGLIDAPTALRELQLRGALTTRWQAVTEDVVKEAEGTPPPPATAVLSNAI